LKPIDGFFDNGAVGICGYYLDNAEHDMIDLINTIIHEAAHATHMDVSINANDIECGATAITISAFNDAKAPLGSSRVSRYAYVSSGRCKLKSTYRIIENRG
jgi:hypothetical protein